jgi:hypothetical protein
VIDKRRLTNLERQIRRKTGRNEYPPPGFFREGDPGIDTYHEELLKSGFTLEQVVKTPVFIE